MARGKLSTCLLCDASTQSSRNTFAIFTQAVSTSDKKVVQLLSSILNTELKDSSVHSAVICKKCYRVCNEIDEIQERLTELSKDLLESYEKTLRKQNEGILEFNEGEESGQNSADDKDTFEPSKPAPVKKKAKAVPPSVPVVAKPPKLPPPVPPPVQSRTVVTVKMVDPLDPDIKLEQESDSGGEDSHLSQFIDTQEVDEESEDDRMEEILEDDLKEGEMLFKLEVKEEQIEKRGRGRPRKTPKLEDGEHMTPEMVIQKGDNSLYRCLLCESVENCDAKQIVVHVSTTHHIKLHICDMCGQEFMKRSELRAHLDEHMSMQEERDFQCEILPRSPSLRADLSDDSDESLESAPSETQESETKETHKGNSTKSATRVRLKICCPFCETNVSNFARHILRCHRNEPEVKSFAWRAAKDPKRLHQLELLRKRGNFVSSRNGNVRPVRRPNIPRSSDQYTTCTKCYGSFVSSNFYRHAKMCHFTRDRTNSKKPRFHHQIAGQNLLVRHLKVDEHLRSNVFPRMKPDKVSLVAKSDALVTRWAARYLRSRRDRRFVPVASRKMRDLAKVLMAARARKPEVETLFDLLRPHYFNDIVAAVRQVAGFVPQTKVYRSPSFAVNIGTSIKECCDIASLELISRKEVTDCSSAADVTAEVQALRDMIEKHWKLEVDTRARQSNNKRNEIDSPPDEEVDKNPDEDLEECSDSKSVHVATALGIQSVAPVGQAVAPVESLSEPPTVAFLLEKTHAHNRAPESSPSLPRSRCREETMEPSKKKKKRVLVPWTVEQKEAVTEFFDGHIRNKRPPKRSEVEELIQRTGQVFANKSWEVIKVFIQNRYSKG